MDELLDIFDDQMIHTGAALRSQVHQAGWWHQTFHCWLYDDVAARVCCFCKGDT
ncbi:hypothetical protein GCM10025858_19320 [Alicyclobacillus sacchari]|uniref:hypothetical protein n=1 Tax=Alicyclobacillus sacchari TaxID=392010 RepID=UPI0023EA0059|nr:hypothetical protein [Alicyclobacillus sacchari]GMA57429.1 hypothetical protein GCM10025858_19320 [Alicyclobacillus sacchari]